MGSGRRGVCFSSRSTARGPRISTPCAALAAEHLLPGEGGDIDLVQSMSYAKRREVASAKLRPSRSAAIQSPLGTRTPLVVPFQVNTTSLARSTAVEVGKLRRNRRRIVGVELELLDRVGHPALAEALPGQHGDRPRAEHRPHRHFERAGVGRRDDADPVVVGQPQQLAHQLDRFGEPRLAEPSAVRAAERLGVSSRLGLQPGGLAQGPEEKYGRRDGFGSWPAHGRASFGSSVNSTLLAESTRRVGTAWPAAASKRRMRQDARQRERFSRCCAAQQLEFARIRPRNELGCTAHRAQRTSRPANGN